ncbi:hypothetical protein [Caldithrix abyssi]
MDSLEISITVGNNSERSTSPGNLIFNILCSLWLLKIICLIIFCADWRNLRENTMRALRLILVAALVKVSGSIQRAAEARQISAFFKPSLFLKLQFGKPDPPFNSGQIPTNKATKTAIKS